MMIFQIDIYPYEISVIQKENLGQLYGSPEKPW